MLKGRYDTRAAAASRRSSGLAGLAGWASRLKLDDVPPRVLEYAKSQVLSQLGAARAALSHPLGEAIVKAFGRPLATDPKESAFVLAALSTCLDFDDTGYAGHLSQSTANVPLAYAVALGLDGRELLQAIVAANETAARVTAAATLGPFRGQTAPATHLSGAVAGRLRAAGAGADRWVDALGIAFAQPPWSLRHAFFASDGKVLTAAAPIRMALDACDAAAAGLVGAPDVLDHPDGYLAQFADVPLPAALTAGLGERWHTETITFKVHPGCAYLSAAIDCAIELHPAVAGTAADIEAVVVRSSIFTVEMERISSRYLRGPASRVSTLNFSTAYSVATALSTGELTAADFALPALHDPVRWQLADKVRVEHDPALTQRALRATAPIGEALRQAGDRGTEWLAGAMAGRPEELDRLDLGAPSENFESADKAMGANVAVTFADGRQLARARDHAVGAPAGDQRVAHLELMRKKFVDYGGPEAVADALNSLEDLSTADLRTTLGAALR